MEPGGGARLPLVVCAPNAFKGTLSAAAAARALARGVTDAGRAARELAVADGGDGTLDVLLAAAGPAGRVQRVRVTGPTGRPRLARLGWIGPDVAVVEMAEASGLRLMGSRRDPMRATSRGTGELIAAALAGGARRVIVGVGGSASTDGGAGILMALGARLLDRRGRPIGPGGGALTGLADVDLSGVDPRLRTAAVEVAVDVRNPLSGADGAAHVYAAQKGADAGPGRCARRRPAPPRRARRARGRTPRARRDAGGRGRGRGRLCAGRDWRPTHRRRCAGLRTGRPRRCPAGASLVITGEGRLDSQTAAGKAPAEVAARAARAGVPCVAVCGTVAGGSELFSAAIGLDQLGEDPRRHVRALLRQAGAQAVRMMS